MKKVNVEKLTKKYKLSKSNHKKVLDSVMEMTFKYKYTTAEPQLVFVIGQPGSGKTTLLKNFNWGSLINIDSDNYRIFIDKDKKIATKYPSLFAQLTNFDAHLIGDEILDYAIRNKYSVVRETSPVQTDVFMKMIDEYSNLCRIKLIVLAMNDINSLLATRERYEKGVIGSERTKLTDMKKHDESYAVVEDIVKRCEKLDNVVIEIYSRDSTYPIQKTGKESCSALLKKARKEDEANSKSQYMWRAEMIRLQMSKRKASEKQFEELEEICERIKKCCS